MWWNSVLRVENVTARIAAVGTDDQGATYELNSQFEWRRSPGSNKLLAVNKGNKDISLTYAVASEQSLVTVSQPLPGNSHYDASKDIIDFRRGTATVTQQGAGLLFHLILPKTGMNYHLASNLTAKILKKGDSLIIKTVSAAPMKGWRMECLIAGFDRQAVCTADECLENTSTWEVPLPAGIDPASPLERLVLRYCGLPEEICCVTSERHRLVIPGQPL